MPQDEQNLPDRPKIYVTRRGERYVKADELLRSKRGRAQLEKMKKFAAWMKAREQEKSA